MAEPLARLLNLPEVELYKADRRSRVWRVADAASDRQYVVKRFEYSPLRQRLAWWLGVHPAQRERRNAEKWAARGVPIVPIVAGGFEGGKAWLATELRGVSLERLIKSELRDDSRRTDRIGRSVATLVAAILKARAFFRDFKTSNIVVDDDDRAWLIDVGSMREFSYRFWPRAYLTRMLAMLDHTASRDGVRRTARYRCLSEFRRLHGWSHEPRLAKQIVKERLRLDRRSRRKRR